MKMDYMLNPRRTQNWRNPINGAGLPTIPLVENIFHSKLVYFKFFTYFASALACSSLMLAMGVV
jgi:hypothetical protein